MVNTELIFQAYLNADKGFFDLKWLADPIKHQFNLLVKNQSNITVYFKLFETIGNWQFGTSLPGSDNVALGGISPGTESLALLDMVRSKPAGEALDTGNFILKAYSDSGYTVEIASQTLAIQMRIEDLENWTDVTISDFDDGTAQGWSLSNLSVVSDKSVEAGGYSLRGTFQAWDSLTKTLSIPNKNKVRIAFFFAMYHTGYCTFALKPLRVLVDGTEVFYVSQGFSIFSTTKGWYKAVADLSAYKGLSKSVQISANVALIGGSGGYTGYLWFDRVVLAGKD